MTRQVSKRRKHHEIQMKTHFDLFILKLIAKALKSLYVYFGK